LPCSEKAEDGKSFINPPAKKKSSAYTAFPDPIAKDRRGGFDVHIYYIQTDEEQTTFATELWERIRRECMTAIKSVS
jgi:DOPA 4,5-dioxygenase